MKRKVLCLLLSMVMAVGLVTPVMAATQHYDNDSVYSSTVHLAEESMFLDIDFFNIAISDTECRMAQVRELVPLLERRNLAQRHSDFDADAFSARTGVFASERVIHDNPRLNRLEELNLIFVEAQAIINNSRNIDDSPIIITEFGGPWEGNDSYEVRLLREEHLALVDLIVDFTGIPEYMLEIIVVNELPTVGREVGQVVGHIDDFNIIRFDELNDVESYQFQSFSMPEIRVGMHIYAWHPSDRLLRNFGTLGHPTDFTGRYVRGTFHGNIWMHSDVLIRDFSGNFVSIGTVVNARLDPSSGVDVSRIRLFGFPISTVVHGIPLTNFHAPVNMFLDFSAIVPNQWGVHDVMIARISDSAWMWYYGLGEVQMRNIIVTRNPANSIHGGDSGAALIQRDGRAIGTLFGGVWTGVEAYFSMAPLYAGV